MGLSKASRPCFTCKRLTTNPMYCTKCYDQTSAGKAEKAMKKYKPIHGGGPCASCLHWVGHCDLGIPEGGSNYARDCSLLLLQNELCDPIHF